MATDQRSEGCASGNLGFYSLTGYLQLHERRGILGKHTLVKYWFWFDDKSCELKYYKKKDQFQQFLLNPLGKIDMRYARVTPSTATHSQSDIVRSCPPSKEFVIETGAHTYILAASSNEEAHSWIKKLQDKRGQWMKSKSKSKSPSRHQIDSSHAVGLLTEKSPDAGTSHVRKLLSMQLKDQPVQKRESFSAPSDLDPFAYDEEQLRPRTTTAPLLSPSQPRQGYEMVGFEQVDVPDPAAIPDGPMIQGHSEELGTLSTQERQILELRQELGETRLEKDRLHRQVIDLQEEVNGLCKENRDLNNQVAELNETLHKLKSPNMSLKQENDMLRNVIQQNLRDLKSLHNEMSLHIELEKQRDQQIDAEKQRSADIERELMQFKAKYVHLLGLAFKINPPSPAGLAIDEHDPDEEKPRECLLQLVQTESSPDNPLLGSKFEDEYGEVHDWSDSNMNHFLCRQLYLHYTEFEQDSVVSGWEQYLKQFKLIEGRLWELPVESSRSKRRELRNMVRRGIPRQYRCQMWGSLVHCWVSKLRDLKNSTADNGLTYYQSLIKPGIHFAFEKQIRLDIYRTLPSNKHFKHGGKGVDKLQRVLLAYSQHNKNVGYCQGMNMIAAIGLLFLDEETTFWFMVTVVEKLMPKNYYTCGLAAAQADQLALKDLLAEKLPGLSSHLDSNIIDVTVVTFNWFLTLFIDALPTEAMLRVMDCFLMEGRKVFFRVSVAILKLNDRRILHMTDPVTIFQFIKEITKHIFDVNELFNVAFNQMKPFPSRKEIQSRCAPHLSNAIADWSRREQQRMQMESAREKRNSSKAPSALLASINTVQRKSMQWECGCVVSSEEVWLCCGERNTGRICIVQTSKIGFDMSSPPFDAKSRVLCMKYIPTGLIIIGTLDHSVHALSQTTRDELWSLKMNDSVLDIAGTPCGDVFCGLADGWLAVLQTEGEELQFSEPLLYRIGSSSVNCVLLTPCEQVWCGCATNITIHSAVSHEPVHSLVTSDRVYRMEMGLHGVWVTYRSSTMLTLYDSRHKVKLLNVNYTSLLHQPDGPGHCQSEYRITTITALGDLLWIGTGNASMHLFSVGANVASPEESIQQIATASEENSRKLLQGLTLTSPGPSSNMSLVGGEQIILETREELEESEEEKTVPKRSDRSFTHSYTMPNRSHRYHKKTMFGRTFRRDKSREGVRKEAGIYQLKHRVSKCVVPEAPDSHRFSVIIPIGREGSQYVISCINCSTDSERGVQLWQCPQSSTPTNWSFTYIPACYEAVSYTPPPPMTPTRGRTYSTVVGASMEDSITAALLPPLSPH